MSNNEKLLLDTIASNVNAENKWSISIAALSKMTGLAKNDITLALHNLENTRYIDQFPKSGTADEVFGLRLVKNV